MKRTLGIRPHLPLFTALVSEILAEGRTFLTCVLAIVPSCLTRSSYAAVSAQAAEGLAARPRPRWPPKVKEAKEGGIQRWEPETPAQCCITEHSREIQSV